MRIVCPIDGSMHSRWAVKALNNFPFPKGSSLIVLHVVDVMRFRPSKGTDSTTQDALRLAERMAEETGQRLLQATRAMLETRRDGVRITSCIARGHPAEAIMQAASREKAELIVIGSRGLTDVRRFLLGSVSRRVVMHASCPVLLIKKKVSAIKRIVVGVDGSKECRRALDYLLALPWRKGTHLTLVSVVSPLPIETSAIEDPTFLEEIRAPFQKTAESVVRQAAERVEQAGVSASTAVLYGHPSHEITVLSRAEHSDLVVIGSRGLTGQARFLMGSVSDGVVKYAPCPVLVFRS